MLINNPWGESNEKGLHAADKSNSAIEIVGVEKFENNDVDMVPQLTRAHTFQSTQLFERMSVLDNVLIAMRNGRLDLSSLFARGTEHDARAMAESMLAFVGYDGPLHRLAGALPHVDKRLVEIARALAARPRVLLVGERIETLVAHRIARKGLVLVPEGRQVFPELSVTDNIRLGAFARRAPDLDAEVERMFARFPRLIAHRSQKAGLLSGGEQQMLAIARGLVATPRVLMLDEPSLGLAPTLIPDLYSILAELRDEGVTILLVDQMAALALSIADRAYVLESGSITHSGTASEIAREPALERAYLGEAQGRA